MPVANNVPGNAVQPHQGLVASRYAIDSTPRNEEHLGGGVVDIGAGKTALAITSDRSDVAVVHHSEIRVG